MKLLAPVLLLVFAASAAAQQPFNDSILEARTRQVSAQLRCPVCQGLSLEDSPSGLSQQMKDVVREQLRQGKTPEEVKAYFVSKYGEWILLEPEPAGFNLLVYVGPVLLLAGGALLIVFTVRRWTRKGEGLGPGQGKGVGVNGHGQGQGQDVLAHTSADLDDDLA